MYKYVNGQEGSCYTHLLEDCTDAIEANYTQIHNLPRPT